MRSVRDMLRDADPLRHEPALPEVERDRRRRAVVAATSDVTTPPSAWFRRPVALWATVALIVVGIVAVGSQIWSQGSATLHAAIRFEVRLAEAQLTPGLREVQLKGSDRVVYLHQEIIVSNSDIAQSSLVPGGRPSRFGVIVRFNAGGAQKMRQATASHVGKPVAILIDGDLVAAPVLTGPISNSAVISGDYTKTEAEAIVHGMSIR